MYECKPLVIGAGGTAPNQSLGRARQMLLATWPRHRHALVIDTLNPTSVIDTHNNPRFLSSSAPCDAAGNGCQALSLGAEHSQPFHAYIMVGRGMSRVQLAA